MAKTKREYIFATFVISCIATVLTIVSIATDEWVVSEVLAVKNIANVKPSLLNYGLFNGVFEKYVLETAQSYKIAVACLFSENICAYSSALTKEQRENEIRDILEGQTCKKPTSKYIKNYKTYKDEREIDRSFLFDLKNNILANKFNEKNSLITSKENDVLNSDYLYGKVIDNAVQEWDYDLFENTLPSKTTTPKISIITPSECDSQFITAGLWLTTVILMMLATLFGGISAFFSVVNTSRNPINQWHSIWGLYIWNGIAASAHLLAMVLWGAQFGTSIKYNVGITDTLRGDFTSDDMANLGYSYWIIFPAMLLHIVNMGIFYLRQYLINKEPTVPTLYNNPDKDGMIFVY